MEDEAKERKALEAEEKQLDWEIKRMEDNLKQAQDMQGLYAMKAGHIKQEMKLEDKKTKRIAKIQDTME